MPTTRDDGFNGPVATNDWDDEYQMNQLWLYLDRPADTGGCGFAVGGHVDMIYGTDWRFGVNNGLEDRINGFDYQRYGLVIPQMYLEVAYNNLSVKLGHFAGILDYEAVPAVMNPFYSHSYSYGYTVPQLVTGAAGRLQADRAAGGAGRLPSRLVDVRRHQRHARLHGWSEVDQPRTSARRSPTPSRSVPRIHRPTSIGFRAIRIASSTAWSSSRSSFEKLQYVAVHNLGTEKNAPGLGTTAEWYGINQYFLYALTSEAERQPACGVAA